MTDLLTESLAALERIQRECAAIVPQLKGDGIQDDTAALQSMLDNPDRYGFTGGIVNLSQAIEVPPLTEAITKASGWIIDPQISEVSDNTATPRVDEDAERAAFEAWIVSNQCHGVPERGTNPFGHLTVYKDYTTDCMWQAVLWRAKRG